MTNKQTQRVNIELSAEAHKQAKITAIESGMPLKDYLRMLIEIGLKSK